MAENPYQSPTTDLPAPPEPKSPPAWLAFLQLIGVLLVIVSAIALECWIHSVGYSAWLFVAAVLLVLAGLFARESWRLCVAFVAAVPVGFLVGAAGFGFWRWMVSHTTVGQLFNDKGSGPLSMFLFVVLPGGIAFALALLLGARLLKVDAKKDA